MGVCNQIASWLISVPIPSGNLAFDSPACREQMAYRDCTINLSDHQHSGALSSRLRRQRVKTCSFSKSISLDSNPLKQQQNPSLTVNNKNMEWCWHTVDSSGLEASACLLMRQKELLRDRSRLNGWRDNAHAVNICPLIQVLSIESPILLLTVWHAKLIYRICRKPYTSV